MTDSGFVNLERVQMILHDLGSVEEEIFRKRRQNELNFQQRQKNQERLCGISGDHLVHLPQGQFDPRAIGGGYNSFRNAHTEIQQTGIQGLHYQEERSSTTRQDTNFVTEPEIGKRDTQDLEDDANFSHDEVRLWEDGFKDRYYESKFSVSPTDHEFRSKVACEYVRGLCWMLQYYYQGCPSWKWYFPYHYAPFASDFQNILTVQKTFERDTKPFSPLEQLLCVFPAASRAHVPESWRVLMTDPESPIIEFYPEDFKIDLNGKKFLWQGVALLPFVDEVRLKQALKPLHDSLTTEERSRNTLGVNIIYVGESHPGHDFISGLNQCHDWNNDSKYEYDMNHKYFLGIHGKLFLTPKCVELRGSIESPVKGLPDLFVCRSVSAIFCDRLAAAAIV